MQKITFSIQGAKEMQNLLAQLGPRVARRVGGNAVRAAAKPIVDEAKRLCPRGERTKGRTPLWRSIAAELTAENDYSLTAKIGARRPAGSHAHLIEFGHLVYNQYGGPWATTAARPFLRPAMDTQAANAMKRMGEVLGSGIDREAKKLDQGRIR